MGRTLNELLNSKVNMRNPSVSNADCNKYIETGIYYLGSKVVNEPQDFIKLIVLGVNKGVSIGDVFQIAGGPSNRNVYCRNGNFKASEQSIIWGEWQCLTQNITSGVEYLTGRFIDSKKEFGLRKNLGALPNSTNTTYKTGLSSSYKIKKYQLFAKNRGNEQLLSIPFIDLKNTHYISGYLDNANLISVMTDYNFSGYDLILEIYYTKN